MKRVLESILEHGRIKRTQLSAKAGMNYARCIKYVNALKVMKLVEIISDNNCNYIILTQTGRDIINMLNGV